STFAAIGESADCDLVILGLGNSLFPKMGDDIMRGVLKKARHAIGIFGTQFRTPEGIAEMAPLIDTLDHWYARYQDDVGLFPRHAAKISLLGDWLINLFPLSEPTDSRELRIDAEVMHHEVALDRTIQMIQRHRFVRSARLHPLLCALTSAEQVAYSEQL